MLNIKHIIAVRFFNWIAKTKSIDFVFDNNVLNEGLIRLKENLLASLNNQTIKDFELILLIHNNLPENHFIINQLNALQNDYVFKISVMANSKFEQYINQLKTLCKRMVITRIDYDDLIFNNAVLDTQQIAQINMPLIIYGYNIGFSWHDNTKFLYKCPKIYNYNGHFSAFQSVIFNSDDYQYNWINPYKWDHSHVKQTLQKYNINSNCILYNTTTYAFVWMRHASAGSLNPYDTTNQIRISNNQDIGAIDFNRIYGKQLNICTV